jgi:hypothetical protein
VAEHGEAKLETSVEGAAEQLAEPTSASSESLLGLAAVILSAQV